MNDAIAVPVVEVSGARKHYGGLRPLRVQHLLVRTGERVALAGFDATSAEILVNLVTGATLPDEGEVRVFGRSTADVRDEREWLARLDRIGIVSARAVLLGASTVLQNLAIPFTLSIDPVPDDIAAKAARLAEEAGIAARRLGEPLSAAPPDVVIRVHLARAIATDPAVLLIEHPTAMLPDDAAPAFAADLVRVAEGRRLAVIAMTEDARFAGALGGRSLKLQAATGALAEIGGWRRWLR